MKLHKYEKSLLEVSKNDPNIIVCTAETRFAMRNIPEILGSKFLDVGIAEQTLIGMAAGLSKMGMFPICHALSSFLLMRPFEFIRTDLGYPNLRSLLVGSFNGFLSTANGPTHQAVDDISLMSQVPNMNIFAPSNIDETCQLLKLCAENLVGPGYLRFSDLSNHTQISKKIAWYDNNVIHKGKETVIVSYGTCFNIISKNFKKNYDNIGLVNCLFVKPISVDFFEKIFDKYSNVIVIEDHKEFGSLCYQLKNLAFDLKYQGNIKSINLGDKFFKPALLNDLLTFEGFDEKSLVKRVKALI